MDLISKKTRNEFQEYLVSTTLREIDSYFDSHDIPFTQLPPEKLPSGARRSQTQQYFASIDWTTPNSVRPILSVFSDILTDIDIKVRAWNGDFAKNWFEKLTAYLQKDGYVYHSGKLQRGVVAASFEKLENATDLLQADHFQEYIERIKKSVDVDPGLAIGSTKELIEAALKTILKELNVPFEKEDDIPKLLKLVQKSLDLVPDDVDDAKKGSDIIKVLLSNLGQVVIKIAELRNLYGTGHGKESKRKGLNDRHARLTVGAGVALATFLLETFELKRKK
jgi:tetratricopeptide (TPR) repeat protein